MPCHVDLRTTKRCSKCGAVKPLEQFSKRSGHHNHGLQYWCKTCFSVHDKHYHQSPRGREARRTARARYQRSTVGKATRARYARTPRAREVHRAANARYNASSDGRVARARYDRHRHYRFPERIKAIEVVNNAVRDGRLVREACEVCGAQPAEAHHDDYSKPLHVRWLCPLCHKGLHRQPSGSLCARSSR